MTPKLLERIGDISALNVRNIAADDHHRANGQRIEHALHAVTEIAGSLVHKVDVVGPDIGVELVHT